MRVEGGARVPHPQLEHSLGRKAGPTAVHLLHPLDRVHLCTVPERVERGAVFTLGVAVERRDRATPRFAVLGHRRRSGSRRRRRRRAGSSIKPSTGTRGSSSWPNRRSRSAPAVSASTSLKNRSGRALGPRHHHTFSHLVPRRALREHVEAGEAGLVRARGRAGGHAPSAHGSQSSSRRNTDASSPIPPTTREEQWRECGWPHLAVVTSQREAAGTLGDATQMQILTLERIGDDERRGRRQHGLRQPLRDEDPPTAAALIAGVNTTGSHIMRFPKLARSCSSQISAPVTAAPARGRAHRARSKRPCWTRRKAIDADNGSPPGPQDRSCALGVASLAQLGDLVAEQGAGDRRLVRLPARNAVANDLACS